MGNQYLILQIQNHMINNDFYDGVVDIEFLYILLLDQMHLRHNTVTVMLFVTETPVPVALHVKVPEFTQGIAVIFALATMLPYGLLYSSSTHL